MLSWTSILSVATFGVIIIIVLVSGIKLNGKVVTMFML